MLILLKIHANEKTMTRYVVRVREWGSVVRERNTRGCTLARTASNCSEDNGKQKFSNTRLNSPLVTQAVWSTS